MKQKTIFVNNALTRACFSHIVNEGMETVAPTQPPPPQASPLPPRKNWFTKLKTWQKILLILACIPLAMIFIAVVFPKPADENKSAQQQTQVNLPSCGTKTQLLSVSPLNPSEISTIIPLGNLAPPGHILPTTHMYYRYIHTNQGSKLTNIYSPADMTITRITLSDNNSLTVPYNSYKIEFALCQEVQGYFILVTTLSDKLKAAFHEPFDKVETSNVGTNKPDHNYWKSVSVVVKAGELIGTGGGGPNMPDALDLGLTDTRTIQPILANINRWPTTEQHYVCSTDYFPENIKQALIAKFGDFDGNVINIDTPQCGTVYQDLPGTAQGVWVAKASTASDLWDVTNNLALAHSNYNHKQAVFSFGNVFKELGIDNSLLYSFLPQTTGNINQDFSKVKTDGKIYCIQAANKQNTTVVILLQLLNDTTLRIGKLNSNTCGTGPWQFAKYLDFIR